MSYPFSGDQPDASGSSNYRQGFSKQNNTQIPWTAQIPSQPSVPLVHYLRLEQELATARRKNQEQETTIVHLANLLCRNQDVPYAFAPPTQISNPSHFQHRFLSTSGIPAEDAGIFLHNSSTHPPASDRSQHCPTTALRVPGSALPLGTRPYQIVHASGLDSNFAKRQRDSAEGEIEYPSKKARHNILPTSTSFQRNSIPPPFKSNSPSFHSTSPDLADASTTSHSDELDWSVEYNLGVNRTLEMSLIRTIPEKLMAHCIKFSPDGQLLAVVGSNEVVTIYNVATGAKICLLKDLYVKEDPCGIYDIRFSSNGKYLATCTEWPENTIRVWEVDKRSVRNVFKGRPGHIRALDFSPDGRLLVSSSVDLAVRIWDMRQGSSRVLGHSDYDIFSVRFSPDGRHVAAGGNRGDISIRELRSGHLVASLRGHAERVSSIVFMPNGEGLISGSWDKTLKYWDITGLTSTWMLDKMRDGEADGAEKKEGLTFVGHRDRINSVSVSPDGQWVASGSDDCTVRIWNSRTGSQQCIPNAHEEDVLSVHFSPAGSYFASAGYNDTLRIWSYKGV